MGMYTECKGILRLSGDATKDEYDAVVKFAEEHDISERCTQCINSTVYHKGQNGNIYIFIGGEMKDYDNDWQKWCQLLISKLPIINYDIKTQYEENDYWLTMEFT